MTSTIEQTARDEAEYIHREVYGEHCCQKDNCFGAYHFSLVEKVLLKALLAAEKRGMERAAVICDKWVERVATMFIEQRLAVKNRAEEIRNAAQKLGEI